MTRYATLGCVLVRLTVAEDAQLPSTHHQSVVCHSRQRERPLIRGAIDMATVQYLETLAQSMPTKDAELMTTLMDQNKIFAKCMMTATERSSKAASWDVV